jgi:hypothetical protein
MRPQQKSNRNRGKSSRKPTGNVVNRVFDSAGPEGKVRGTPQQIIEKYESLARDAQTSGDRVMAENFLQHAEHYSRLLGVAQAEREAQQRRENPQQDQQAPQQPPQQQRDQFASDRPAKSGNGAGLGVVDPSEMEQPDLVVNTPEGRPAPVEAGGARRRPGSAPAASVRHASPRASGRMSKRTRRRRQRAIPAKFRRAEKANPEFEALNGAV